MFDRADAIDSAFVRRLTEGRLPDDPACDTPAGKTLSDFTLMDIFDTQIMSRHLDLMARRTKGRTFYSIGSAGHEGMAALALATRRTDMGFLHYRDGAFLIQRAKALPGTTPLYDMTLSFCASAEDPVSGGRHKVLGSRDLFVPPQTSTIASHLPKAVGAAHSLGLARKVRLEAPIMPNDAIIVCSFGDASANHSTAQGAINAAAWAARRSNPMPILFVCEDNGIGISVETPRGWIEDNFRHRPGLTYFACDTRNPETAFTIMRAAARYCRTTRSPVFLHARTIRLMGHAGADIEAAYAPLTEIERCEALDPLLVTARLLITRNIASAADLIGRYDTMRARIERILQVASARPKLESRQAITASLIPPKTARKTAITITPEAKPVPLSRHINAALGDILQSDNRAVIFGEDVGRKGGVYGVSAGLQKRFGRARVFDTLLDEQAILGLAIGLAHNGFIPIPEIQFLAYLHNAEDQLRGEAATLSFFSNGQFTNPMVIRIAGLGYQKGFGGHFHNDNSIAVIRDIPGIILACPSNARDAGIMMIEAYRLAAEENRVVVFLEPIALYNTTDLIESGDGLALAAYGNNQDTTPFGTAGLEGDPSRCDCLVISYGNGAFLSRQARHDLQADGITLALLDLRWLHPLPIDDLLPAARKAPRLLIVDECRRTGSLSEAIMTALIEDGISVPVRRITADDSFIPLGTAATLPLPSRDEITKTVRDMLRTSTIRAAE